MDAGETTTMGSQCRTVEEGTPNRRDLARLIGTPQREYGVARHYIQGRVTLGPESELSRPAETLVSRGTQGDNPIPHRRGGTETGPRRRPTGGLGLGDPPGGCPNVEGPDKGMLDP